MKLPRRKYKIGDKLSYANRSGIVVGYMFLKWDNQYQYLIDSRPGFPSWDQEWVYENQLTKK